MRIALAAAAAFIGMTASASAHSYYLGHTHPYGHYHGYVVTAPAVRVVPSPRAAHVSWCASRYRSYRSWDNTFQPYYGGRQFCVSPYGY